jgi:hypothetical protein
MRVRLVLSGALIVAAFAFGCSSNTVDPENVDGPQFLLRTSPDNVLENIMLAYEEMMAPEYLDCLSEDFVFYPCEEDVNDPNSQIPPEWYKIDETTIHNNMFDEGSGIENIQLTLTITDAQFDEGYGADPSDDIWIYLVAVDLWVHREWGLTLFATTPSEFWFRKDVDQAGPQGRTLWEIYKWYDLGAEDGRGGSLREESSWGAIKAMYK